MTSTERRKDKEEIRSVIKGLSDAWEQNNGTAWGSYFVDDADFTVWFGLHLHGRKDISEGHQWLFDTVYPNTRYELEISDFRFLGPDIAVLHINGSIIEPGESPPDEPHSLPVAVFQRGNNEWKIVMFHNMKNRKKEIEEGRSRGEMGDIRK